MLKCSNVSIKYENFYALRDVSFELKNGEYLCIVGENGSGKSSLVKAILGLIPAAEGEIVFDKKEEIGYLSQNKEIQSDFPASVSEVVLSGQIKNNKIFYTKAQKELSIQRMKQTGVYEIRNKCFRELSGGMRQRVLLARALCASPSLLVLDEPMTGLDFTAVNDMYKTLIDLKKSSVTIIMVSHDINGALKYADKILYIGHGGNFFGTCDEFTKSGKILGFGGAEK